MAEKQYKQEAMDRAIKTFNAINSSTDKYVTHKAPRPVTDLKQMMISGAEIYGDRVAFQQRFERGKPFEQISFKQALADINSIGTKLIDMGLKGAHIAVIGENCYQWAISYLAIGGGVGVIVPLDKELPTEELAQLIEMAEVSAVIFTKKQESKFKEIQKNNPNLKYLINMDIKEDDGDIYSLYAIVQEGKNLIAMGKREYVDAIIDPEALAVILFTSGTTGVAKGVMLNSRNLAHEVMIATTLLEVTPNDVTLAILPLHHTFECTCEFLTAIYAGACVSFCEGLKYIQKNLKEIKPTIIEGVPLIYNSLYKTIMKTLRKRGKEESVKKIINTCKMLGPVGRTLQQSLLKDIYDVFGGRLRTMISGGAASDITVMNFFNDLGFKAIQGYGLTECAPLVTLNPDNHKLMRNESVGHVLPCVECRIDNPDKDGVGEICFKGDNVMMGYYKMPEETAAVLIDGWFHTGDIGYIDSENFVYITGRRKNVIITPNGKNVFPEELENYLEKSPLIAEAMVWADKDESGQDTVIIATVVPDKETVELLSGRYNEEKAYQLISAYVDELNARLPLFKQIRRIVIREDEFEKNSSHKIKRFVESNKRSLKK